MFAFLVFSLYRFCRSNSYQGKLLTTAISQNNVHCVMMFVKFDGSILFRPPVFFVIPVTNITLLYSTLQCKKIARALGGH